MRKKPKTQPREIFKRPFASKEFFHFSYLNRLLCHRVLYHSHRNHLLFVRICLRFLNFYSGYFSLSTDAASIIFQQLTISCVFKSPFFFCSLFVQNVSFALSIENIHHPTFLVTFKSYCLISPSYLVSVPMYPSRK